MLLVLLVSLFVSLLGVSTGFVIEDSVCTMCSMFKSSLGSVSRSSLSYINSSLAKAIDVDLMTSFRSANLSTFDYRAAHGFSIDSLMELAGLSVAIAANDYSAYYLPSGPPEGNSTPKVCVLCGPGNNGGDGLVAARHLKHWGYDVTIIYPGLAKLKDSLSSAGSAAAPNSVLFMNLLGQCHHLDIPIRTKYPFVAADSAESLFAFADDAVVDPEEAGGSPEGVFLPFDLVIDSVFGFSYDAARQMRAPYRELVDQLIAGGATERVGAETLESAPAPVVSHKVLSVDIPSGWNVDSGVNIVSMSVGGPRVLVPGAVISLTTPKQCMAEFDALNTCSSSQKCSTSRGTANTVAHYLGGRFLPPKLAVKFGIRLPEYGSTGPGEAQSGAQVVAIRG